ncbi:MAG: esterase/lipase family protein [Syntrophobacteraceae bacterium]
MKTLFCLVMFLFCISIAVSLFTYSFFWYENAGTVRKDREKRLTWMMLRGILSGIAGLPFLMLTYPLGFIRPIWRPKRLSPGQPVIILAHGLFHNASAWLLFRRQLQRVGFTNIFVMNYRSIFTSFDDVLKRFEKFVADAASAVPDQPVYLIGHSLGGLVSRVYAERYLGETIPAAIITLGSPHQGSKMAAFGLGTLAESLQYRGPLFVELEREPARLPCPGIALFSPVDNLVLPFEGLKVPYIGWIYHETDPVSHVSMLYSRTTARKVIELLHNGSFPQPADEE